MKGFTAFMKKELLEAVRSYKLVVLLIVFAALGFMSPVSTCYLPGLATGFLPEGMHTEIPQPVVLDSWLQFFKNTVQIGLIATITMCSSSMANEIGKGVLMPLLAKGMPRNSALAAKFISISCLWTLSLGCSFLITFLYNLVFWESSLVSHLFPFMTGVWLSGLAMTASMILGGVYEETVSGSLLCAGYLFLLCVLITVFAAVTDYSPFMFLSRHQFYLTDGITIQEFLKPAVCAVTATLLQLAAAVITFRRKSLQLKRQLLIHSGYFSFVLPYSRMFAGRRMQMLLINTFMLNPPNFRLSYKGIGIFLVQDSFSSGKGKSRINDEIPSRN